MSLILSVDDTNKLREKVGLKPIPVPEKKNLQPSISKDETKIVELTISETNELRKKLGLKLIPDEDSLLDEESRNYQKLKDEEYNKQRIEQVRSEISKTKSELKSSDMLRKGGLLDRVSSNSSVMDFDSWLDKVGAEVKVKAKSIKKLSFKKEKTSETSMENAPIEANSSDLTGGKVLTAKDVNVLSENENEEFENKQETVENEILKSLDEKKSKGKLVPFNDANHEVEKESKKRKLESLHEALQDEIDSTVLEEEKINNILRRDVSKFKKPKKSKGNNEKRKRVFSTALEDREFKPVILSVDDEEKGDNDLENLLNMTRVKSLKSRRFEYDNAPEDSNKNTFIDENIEFLNRVHLEKKEPQVETEPIRPNVQDTAETETNSFTRTRYVDILNSDEKTKNPSYGVSDLLDVIKLKTSTSKISKDPDDINIVYTDDDGRRLDQKEAFKYLSRKFHGSKKK